MNSSRFGKLVAENEGLIYTPVLSIPSILFPTEENYCTQLKPYLNNENTMSWLYESLLCFSPSMTLHQLASALYIIKISLISFFIFYLLYVGVNIIFATMIFLGSLVILLAMPPYSAFFTPYSFIQPFMIGFIALLGMALSLKTHLRMWSTVIIMPIISLMTFLFINLRTSFAPIIISCLITYLVFIYLDSRKYFSKNKSGVICFLSACLLLGGYQYWTNKILTPISNHTSQVAMGFDHHGIVHPLVLGLAIPNNALAKQYGIIWRDRVGPKLAKEIDPSVKYAQLGYERALLVFYLKLWIYHPRDMVNIYFEKLQFSGLSTHRAFCSWLRKPTTKAVVPELLQTAMSHTLYLLRLFPRGLMFCLGYIFMLAFLFRMKADLNAGIKFGIFTLAISGLATYMESAIIHPQHSFTHSCYLTFSIWYMCLFFWQFFANLLYGLFAMTKKSREIYGNPNNKVIAPKST